jgi:hypothetical protein
MTERIAAAASPRDIQVMALEHLPSYSDALTLQAMVSAVSGGLVRLPAERRASTMVSSLKDVLGKLQLLVSTYVSPAAADDSDSEDEASATYCKGLICSSCFLTSFCTALQQLYMQCVCAHRSCTKKHLLYTLTAPLQCSHGNSTA